MPIGPGARVATSLRSAMRRSTRAELARILDAKGDTLTAARATNLAIFEAPTLPAVERYTGVLYTELDYRGLSVAARRRFDRSALIFSALHGVIEAREPISEYRLGFGAKLGRLGNLAGWWRPHVTATLADRLNGATVWDLLPGEHAAAWRPGEVAIGRRFVVVFLDAQGRTVSHWNKLLKGALAGHLVRHGLDDPAVLESFEHPTGYRWDPASTVVDGNVTRLVVRETGRSR